MTDHSSDTPGGMDAVTGEPSMEDILASIRRIIAEDDVADQSHVDAGATDSIIHHDAEVVSADVSLDDLGLDEVLVLEDEIADLSESEPVSDSIEAEELIIPDAVEAEFNPVSNVVSDLEGKLNQSRETVLDNDIMAEENAHLSDMDISDDPIAQVLSVDLANDEILAVIGEEARAEKEARGFVPEPDPFDVITGAAPSLEEASNDALIDEVAEIDSVPGTESDLDLVKSLMADLTDTSFLSEDEELGAELDTESSFEDIPPATAAIETANDDVVDDIVADLEDISVQDDTVVEDDILDDILEMALTDEESIDLDGLELTVDTPEEALEPIVQNNGVDQTTSSLLQIAALAEADALKGATASDEDEIEVEIDQIDETAILEEADLLDEIAEPAEDAPTTEELLNELDQALAEVTEETASDSQSELDVEELLDVASLSAEDADLTEDLFIEPQETEDMARTARKEPIIDEVTETATADAFAELNRAVEDKAVFTESGPRVGELVQDALRPMLKEWLDENLKSIVERAVAKEVKRISSGK